MVSLIKMQEFEIEDDEVQTKDIKLEEEDEDEEMSAFGLIGDEGQEAMTLGDAVERILDSVIPPRDFERNGRKYRMTASRQPATRADVVQLEDLLDKCLRERQARLIGLCPVRRELYEQCFDELIRQSTLASAARGALLLRVRDELRMTIAAYESLYESGVAYGSAKSLESENRDRDLEDKVRNMREEMTFCKEKIKEVKSRIKMAIKVSAEQRAINEKRHLQKMEYLRKTNEQLKSQLELMKKK